ncbi:protein FAM179A isoform C [Alligator mississippiensis]|uniref:Protein FAM179A isoform C n=1 Tax=Alligator mississippiensis TaxID=8496 RepID=A0A151P327_ALLMI|nr:protein FAM179A isoform C [Alligator mississippiensis]
MWKLGFRSDGMSLLVKEASGRYRKQVSQPLQQTASQLKRGLLSTLMATHGDFTAAKFQTPIAVYCGSVPKVKPRCRSLRGGSVDSNLQLCGSRWTTAEEGWDSQSSIQHLDTATLGDASQIPCPTLKHDPRELEVSSAAMETSQIKDKLKKRRMSEGLLAPPKGLSDSSDPKGAALKPAVSRSASQRLLITSKPMPPIQSIPTSPEANGPSEKEQKNLENGMGNWSSSNSCAELLPASQEFQASLQYLQCNDEKMKKSLGAALIPPIPKSARTSNGDLGTTPVPLPGAQQLDPVSLSAEDSPEIRSRPDSSIEEKTLKSLEFKTSAPILAAPKNGLIVGMKPTGYAPEPLLPLTTLSLGQGKETGHLLGPKLLKDDNWKESNGRIHVTISKSAQEKLRQKQMKEMELLRREREKEREKERSLQLREQLQSVDPRGIAQEVSTGFGPLNTNGLISISPSMSNPCRASFGVALKKRVNRPSLPSIPIINHESSFLRHSSANSLPANILGSSEWEEESESGDMSEMRPFSLPEQGMMDALKWLSSNDWQLKEKGLSGIRRLATCHSEVLLSRIHDVSLAVIREISNLRSKVSRFAISTLGELFRTMKKHMDQEVEETARVLLQKTGDSSEFIQKVADQSLGLMVGNVTPARAMAALMANGVNHRNPLIRRCTAEHLLTIVEQIGAEKLLSGTRDSTELLVRTLVKLAQDSNQDTRFYGRKMLNALMPHPKFDGYLKQSLPSHDLRDVMATIKQKGMEDDASEPPSAKGHRESRNSSLTISRDSLPSDEGSSADTLVPPQPVVRRSSLRSLEVIDQLKELNKLLTAKEFQMRMEGITLLTDHCRNNPQFVSSNIIQIFDDFTLRLQDSNKKVNQYALESVVSMIPVLRDGLHPVMVSMVTVVTDNLNSKNSGIYSAAVKVLETLITHLDNVLLLQTFASRVRFTSGRAMQDITQHLSVLVTSVYPRKPQAVERHVLPILWYFLSNMIGNGVLPGRSGNVRTVVSKLAKTLHKEMGPTLLDHAASQPQHAIKNLQDLLGMGVQ